MDKTSKTSIAAIIFVIIYFLFIIFISLFKGITLYDIKLNNLNIDKLFIKLDKKIILKIDNLKIYTTKSYKKEALKLHKLFYYTTKILPLFKEISIFNIYRNDTILIDSFILKQDNFLLNTPFIFAIGQFKIYKNYSSIYFDKIRYKNYFFKNTTLFSYYTKNYVFANIKTFYKKHPIYIALKADDNFVHYALENPNISLKYKDFFIKLKNTFLSGKINTYFNYIDAKFNNDFLKIYNKNINITASNSLGMLKNNIINIKNKISTIKYNLYTIKTTNSNLNYNLKNKDLMSDSKKIKINYKDYNVTSNNLSINYNLNNKSFFLHTLNIKMNNDINASSNELIISKLPKLYFYFKNNSITHKYFSLNNNYIKGNQSLIILNDLIGKIIGYETNISSPKIYLQKKLAFSNNINFNNIQFLNTQLNFSKKPYILTSKTNALFNKDIKNILKKFNINIPITQIKGKNSLNFKITFDNKLHNITYTLDSANDLFKFYDINFSLKKLTAKGDINYSAIQITNFYLPFEYFNTLFDANSSININQKYINSFIFLKYLNIDSFLNIKNFKEKLAMDLRKNIIFLLNSAIFINLNNKTIIFYSLKNLLKYSIFDKIFTDGNIIVKFLKNKINIYADTLIKYPLILNQKNPNSIKATFEIKDKNIYIQNNHLYTKIINLNKIYSYINNVDINISALLNIINQTKTITKIINKDTNNSNELHTTIIANNTNFIYKKHKFLTTKAHLYINKEINFSASYNKSILNGYTKNDYLLIEGKNYNKVSLVPLLDFFKNFENINLDFILVRSPQNFYTGKIYINKATVKELGVLNNIIAFINTIPSLLSLQTPGFSAKGYKIKSGYISYLFYQNILYLKEIKIKGVNIDFYGKGYVDLNKNYIKMKINTVLKIKLKKIPIIGKGLSYILFGEDGYLHINIFVKGDLNNPKITKDLGGIIESPLKLFKRIITLPFNLF